MNKNIHIPSDVEVLINFHIFQTKHPREDAPAVKDAIKHLIVHNIIAEKRIGHEPKTTYFPTNRGKV